MRREGSGILRAECPTSMKTGIWGVLLEFMFLDIQEMRYLPMFLSPSPFFFFFLSLRLVAANSYRWEGFFSCQID
ncbi:hypothetical protein I7I50_07718 [Histoplasma capsulatum G186AR]|nr:hypothetical protein I7I50_07718 [Histoplasma capsulatum G186AR]